MATDYFLGWTEAELADELKMAQKELALGGPQPSLAFGGGSASTQIQLSVTERIRLLMLALYRLNPTDYPLTSVRGDATTRITFS